MTPPNRPPNASALIQRQFGAHADDYVLSADHVRGESLDRMMELIQLPAGSRALDIATGGGHTARALQRKAERVIGTDLTHRMLLSARNNLAATGGEAVAFVRADAHRMPFASETFDLVACRLAAHHFSDAAGFVRACARVTRRSGLVAVIDNVTPPDADAARFINAYETLRDPGHHHEYSTGDFIDFFEAAGLTVEHTEEFRKPIRFQPWLERMSVPERTRQQLRAMLRHAPGAARDSLNPREVDGQLTFDLGEALIIGRRK